MPNNLEPLAAKLGGVLGDYPSVGQWARFLACAFFLLISELYHKYGAIIRPASQGNFSVLQIRPDGRNCFAFKGAKNRIRFYFRKPAFEEGPSIYKEVLEYFPSAEEVQGGEIAVNINCITEAKSILRYLEKAVQAC